ncbi:NAP1-related protein 1 [Capsicum chinense]|nr:NAP1-related protein 1 [Capsicum chinense]
MEMVRKQALSEWFNDVFSTNVSEKCENIFSRLSESMDAINLNIQHIAVHNLLPDRQPVYDKRNDIIKAIPDFWLTSFLSHPVLGKLLNEEDHKFLRSVEVEDNKDVKTGYTITFNFNSNSYFENTKLHDDITVIVMYLDRPERSTNAGSNIVKGTNNPLDIYSMNTSYVSP